MRTRMLLVVVAVAAVLAVTGCASDTISARFLRYEKATDGSTYAIVELGEAGEGDQVRAYVKRTDLEPNEKVRVKATGRSWDMPQTKPSYEVVR